MLYRKYRNRDSYKFINTTVAREKINQYKFFFVISISAAAAAQSQVNEACTIDYIIVSTPVSDLFHYNGIGH